MHQPPLVFDFIFAPAETFEESSESPEPVAEYKIKKTKQVGQTTDDVTPQPMAASAGAKSEVQEKTVKKEISEAVLNQPTLSRIFDQPKFIPETESSAQLEDRYAVSAVKPNLITTPLFRFDRPSLVPAKISISQRQHKMLRKKIKKWAEDFHRMELSDSTTTWKHKGRVYSAKFRHLPAKTNTDMDELLIEVRTEENGVPVSTQMRMKRLAFSNFAQFVNWWHPWVAVHDDVLEGRFHSNTKINVSSSSGVKPTFYGKVTTAAFEVRRTGNQPFFDEKKVFLGGIETGVKAIHLPKHFLPFISDSTISVDQIQRFTEDTKIIFHPDGTFSWRSIDSSENEQRRKLPESAFYIIGDKKTKLRIQGVVKGKVLIYSQKKIIIDADLTYSRLPEISSLADDYLGLVCDDDIEIAHPSVTGPGNLKIYAAIYAKDKFKVPNRGGKRGAELYIYGSLTAGTLMATEPRYSTHIRFDKRLENKRPPNFPMTDRYEMTEWDEKWEIRSQ